MQLSPPWHWLAIPDGMSLSSSAARAWRIAKAIGAKTMLDAAFGRQPVILMYHRFSMEPMERRISASEFDWQMTYLVQHCNVISWTELISGLRNQVAWRPGTVAISVDDGYSDLYEVAFPILKKHGLPATAFVTSGFAAGCFWHWPDQLHFILTNCKQHELRFDTDGGTMVLALQGARALWHSWNTLADVCYELSDSVRDEWISRISRIAKVSVPEQPPSPYRPANWSQLQEMVAAGLSIGAHSVTHPRLTRLANEQLVTEIAGGKITLENELQTAVTSFAYPFGTPADHDERVRKAVRQAGFESGCVAYFDQRLYNDLYALPRFGVGADAWDFLKSVDGLKRARSLQKTFFQNPQRRA